ncbi:class I SAM-dependent methyltransferase [Bacillus sp. CECT 9360]|uniref:class I SAM-dependent methyltransferase n=1 Tax=Bacillus sp. CECT 9360 TaxID=2845821 RepID=UPI001E4B52F5|nr:class I SAM-dependent methyltransferase [Bacillus sp. CECT 9360]CAH0345274.1 Trans-aconitate 2-methyltransferase [Bacillus sp. CECT 9360]
MKKDYWNANLYDAKHSFVSKFGEDVVKMLAPSEGEHILDLGCGTGDLANALKKMGVHIIGVDKSDNMIQQAQIKYPDIKFEVEDALNLDYDNQFDAVFSNATLHWVKPPEKALDRIYTSLKQGGRFVAEFGGKGNVQIITDEIITQFGKFGIGYDVEKFPWYFPSIGEYSSLMENEGFRVRYAHHFDRPTPLEGDNGLRNWIEMFADSMFDGLDVETKDTIITEAEKSLSGISRRKGEWVADYKRIQVIGIKE